MGDASYRVSDAEREQAVVVLREHLLAGRLTLEEFSERVEATLGARVGADLARVQQDLPAVPAPSRRKPARFTGALFGHVVRRGRLRLRHWTLAVSALADVNLDLREASTDSPQTTLTVFAVGGNADIYVPEGLNVDVSGLTVFGHHRDWGHDVAAADAPAICVRVIGVLGTIDVWRVPHGLSGGVWGIVPPGQHRSADNRRSSPKGSEAGVGRGGAACSATGGRGHRVANGFARTGAPRGAAPPHAATIQGR